MMRLLPIVVMIACATAPLFLSADAPAREPRRRPGPGASWAPPPAVAPVPGGGVARSTPPYWGALVNFERQFYWNNNKESAAAAEADALKACRAKWGSGCTTQTVLYSSCISVATGSGKDWGWGADQDWKNAVHQGISACGKAGCRSYFTYCTKGGKIDQEKVASVAGGAVVIDKNTSRKPGGSTAKNDGPDEIAKKERQREANALALKYNIIRVEGRRVSIDSNIFTFHFDVTNTSDKYIVSGELCPTYYMRDTTVTLGTSTSKKSYTACNDIVIKPLQTIDWTFTERYSNKTDPLSQLFGSVITNVGRGLVSMEPVVKSHSFNKFEVKEEQW